MTQHQEEIMDEPSQCVAENSKGTQCRNLAWKDGEWCHLHNPRKDRRYTGDSTKFLCCPAPNCKSFGRLVDAASDPDGWAVLRWQCTEDHGWVEHFGPHPDGFTTVDTEMVDALEVVAEPPVDLAPIVKIGNRAHQHRPRSPLFGQPDLGTRTPSTGNTRPHGRGVS